MITIPLPFTSPPLRSNDRADWHAKAKTTREVRQAAAMVARRKRVKWPVAAILVWTVTDARRRDAGASAPTLKAVMDGLVDAGVLPDDNHRVVLSETCRIERGPKPAVRVELLPIDPDDLCECPACAHLFASVADFDNHRRTEC